MSSMSTDRSTASPTNSPINERRNAPRKLVDLVKIREVLQRNWLLWMSPTVAFTVLGFFYAVTKSSRWQASQAVIVREEAIGDVITSAGRFDTADALKRSLETILQVAKNQQVIANALRQVDPKRAARKGWPSDIEIESTQKDISVTAPKGTEFGASEVVYLNVEHKTPEKAIALHNALSRELEVKLRELRDHKLRSVVEELSENVQIAESELQQSTTEVAEIEQKLGSDLGELLTMTDQSGSSGDSNLRSQFNQIKNEIRQAEALQESRREVLGILEQTGAKAEALIATPNSLLETQPALRRMKDGLVEAQLRTARLRGAMTDDHPRVQAALLNEQNILSGLQTELHSAIEGLKADVNVNENVLNSLRGKLEDVRTRLNNLAGFRTTYENLIADVNQKRQRLQAAQASLSQARARQEAVGSTSLISRLDEPVTGSGPLGPGRLAILFGSSFGGLLVGLSLVYLVAPWQASRAAGRRATDQAQRSAGRRLSDAGVTEERPNGSRTAVPRQELSEPQPTAAPSSPAEPTHRPGRESAPRVKTQTQPPQVKSSADAKRSAPSSDARSKVDTDCSPMELFRHLQATVPSLEDSSPFDFGSPRDSELLDNLGTISEEDDESGERELQRVSSIISQTLVQSGIRTPEYSDDVLQTMVCDVAPPAAPGTDTDPSLSNLINLLQYRPKRSDGNVALRSSSESGRDHG